MFCPFCGATNNENTAFCVNCGADLSENQNSQQPVQQTVQQPAQYQAPQVDQPPVTNETVTVGQWMLTLFLLIIPVANIILTFVWAFSKGVKPSKRNFCKAMLVFELIGIIVGVVAVLSIIAVSGSIFGIYY